MSFLNMDQAYVANTYKRFPVEIVSGKGSRVVDVNGKSYVDMGSGIGVTAFGFGDEAWMAAVTEQLGKVQHTSNLYYTEPCAKLAKLLCEKTGMKKVFFSNSGAESNECAIKVARKYSAAKKGADCYTIISLVNSFHGRTLTTLAATGQDHFHKDFQPLTPGFAHVPANDIEALTEAVATLNPAGIMLECVQGEGGVIPLHEDFVKGVATLPKGVTSTPWASKLQRISKSASGWADMFFTPSWFQILYTPSVSWVWSAFFLAGSDSILSSCANSASTGA